MSAKTRKRAAVNARIAAYERAVANRVPAEVAADCDAMSRIIVRVIRPGRGVWGGSAGPGTLTVIYRCPDSRCGRAGRHEHEALYGPSEHEPGRLSIWAD